MTQGRTGMAETVRLMIVVATVAAALSIVLVATPAQAAVGCGTVVTADLTLDADLVCNAADGLIAGEDGITIDLNGFTIRNTGGGIVTGVSVVDHANVTVRNGTVRGFYENVAFVDSPFGVAADLIIRAGGGYGLQIIRSDDSIVKRVDVRNVPDGGVVVTGSVRVQVDDVVARRSGWGVFVIDSVGTTIERADLRRNFYGVSVYVSHGTVVADSTIRNNTTAGVASEASTKTQVRDSVIRANGIGVHYFGSSEGGRIQDNAIARNAIGVQLGTIPGPGAAVPADGVLILNNKIRNNDGSGIVIDQDMVTGSAHRVFSNRVTGNGTSAAGLVDSTNARLDDGIHIVSPAVGVELKDNRANRNHDYGIEARDATDLSGNRARGNGNSAQCLGVSC